MTDPDSPRPSPPPRRAKAVALNYTRGADKAPRVVARGGGEVAERIVELALAHGVKVREDADLVEILERVDLDEAIPLEAFAAVAEILAQVYLANNRLREAHKAPNPDEGTR
ncbi:EscU/YscU/HrcU family type III secretion system export apparatus switch protein [Zavarzinia compransoris]|uniref:Flagellar protein FhlB n=1 Tax=Zavarzinia compransoris TaxID=1264899 RepID=A0A317DYI9_9PROT|nr:EscU/YscU/HrcU family type III secretion system export apparatus switch protein [Zavarzinia compransoris]PWR19808.1 flagellar protein FhlB [Zavarzinia compransoris]TDP45087.1 flagellar biosynthesis protein [Zavarzinia compransoris]